jgi:glutamyl-tRNA synthetase
MVITRFAPSPTGDPHIGNIRTALFNYLFATHSGGKFMLRIEDTDRERHNSESIDVIKEALRWLDIAPENIDDPVIQSTRLEKYKAAALKLVDEGKAYVCNCSRERLEEVKKDRATRKLAPGYDGHCRDLKLPYQDGCVIRMVVPRDRQIEFNDLIRGKISFDSNTIDDQIILKSDGFPTYHLAHVIDDHEMGTTHVFRGDEWLPSVPKHIILFEMMGYEPPIYAHLPVILSANKGKLSKRDGATTILEYKKMGYLPEAVVNFIALLGWNPKTDEEFFTLEELVKRFDEHGINKSSAVFDINKLNSFNSHYLMNQPQEKLIEIFSTYGMDGLNAGEADLISRGGNDTIIQAIESIKNLRHPDKIDADKLVFRKSTKDVTLFGLQKSFEKLSDTDWNNKNIQEALESVVAENNLTNGDVFWPIRYALSSQEKSPPPGELCLALGKQEALSRIKTAIDMLEGQI